MFRLNFLTGLTLCEKIYLELLLGERNYGPAVDMWGAGCIMAELWTRYPIMQGNTEQQQIMRISQLCGSFTPDVSDHTIILYKNHFS